MVRAAKIYTVSFLIMVLLVSMLPSHAQEVTPTATPPPVITFTPPMDVGPAGVLLITVLASTLAAIVAIPAASVFVTTLTGLVKRYLPTTISGGAISLTINVILWVLYTIGVHYALFSGAQFQNILTLATSIIIGIAGGGANQIVATAVFNRAAAQAVPVLGYERTPGTITRALRADRATVKRE